MLKLFLIAICISALINVDVNAGMTEKQLKSAGKLVRNSCQPKNKATDEMIENIHKGVWKGEKEEKCYMFCVLLTYKANCIARAIFDNIAESQDELSFRKNDLLIVLEQNTANMEGWWLCTLRGRQGICPGNRLRLIPGYFHDPGSRGSPSPQFTDTHSAPNENNCLQKQGKRQSWHVQPNKVITPRRYHDVYIYDNPPNRCSPISIHSPTPSQQSMDYDVPPKAVPLTNCARSSSALSCASPVNKDAQENYDIPKPLLHSQNMLTPSSSASSLSLTGDSFSSSNRSSLINMPDYDVPRSHASKGPQLLLQAQPIYDVPPPQNQIKELPLEISSALDNLERLQSETTSVISRLLNFATCDWRTFEKLDANILEIKLAVIRLKTSLHDFAEFCEGALGNATRATDKNLASKLVPLVRTLKSADKLIYDATEKLNHHNWDAQILSRNVDDTCDKFKPDELEQIIECTRSLTEDIRQAASFIQGNSTLLFKKDSQPNAIHVQANNNLHQDDYDYVNLETKEAFAKSSLEIRNELPKELQKNYDCMVKNVEEVALSENVNSDDKQILTFFAHQTTTHHTNLTQAIDAFLKTVEHNQPPKMFLAHGKFVVLSAHKLVHIGDTVSKGVSNAEIKTRALNCANALSDALATSVTKTKQAALQFPNVTAVQEMVNSVVDISDLARDLKLCLVQAALQ